MIPLRLAEIAGIVHGPVSAEVVALDHEGMMREAEILRKIADNIAVKVPLTPDGLKTCKKLTGDGTMVNVTLCFSANQALLAAKAGATFVSPFVGRHDDNGFDGMDLIRDIRLWHAGTVNRAATPRPMLALIYTAGWWPGNSDFELPRAAQEQLRHPGLRTAARWVDHAVDHIGIDQSYGYAAAPAG